MEAKQLLSTTMVTMALIFSTTALFAQVKIGSNPTVIAPNENLQVEATNGYQTVVQKSNGYVGVNTLTPSNLFHVSASLDSEGALVNLKNGTSSVYASSDGGVTVTRVGTSKSFAPHIGGFLDLTGQTGSLGWRFAQYAGFLGIGPIPEGNINIFPMYVHNAGRVSMGTSAQFGAALLTVNGQIAGVGFCTRAGTAGPINGNNFNISWNGTNAGLWIDNVNFGAISTTSDYRLKKNVVSTSGSALERVQKLRPVSFEYKDVTGEIFRNDRQVHEGFIAHELQAVIPSAVNGHKDALTKEGKIQPQTLNPFPVISVLTRAIQEQQAEIEALKSDNLALKAQAEQMHMLSARLAAIEAKLPATATVPAVGK